MMTQRDLNPLNAARKADREVIANALSEIATGHGASVERQHRDASPGYCGQGIHLAFACKGVGAMLEVNDLHGGDWTLIHWFNARPGWHERARPVRDFTSQFQGLVGSGGNGRPHHKATSHPRDWNSLAKLLDAGLLCAARGEAFQESPAT